MLKTRHINSKGDELPSKRSCETSASPSLKPAWPLLKLTGGNSPPLNMPGGRAQALKSKKGETDIMKNYIMSMFECYYNAFLRW